MGRKPQRIGLCRDSTAERWPRWLPIAPSTNEDLDDLHFAFNDLVVRLPLRAQLTEQFLRFLLEGNRGRAGHIMATMVSMVLMLDDLALCMDGDAPGSEAAS